jgi:neutral trehalase
VDQCTLSAHEELLDWWLKHRTDKDGWFHCKCSWESGQDASKRFLVAEGNPAAVSDFVRTVDVEAAMAEAFLNMVLFSAAAGHPQDTAHWRSRAERRLETTRAMYVDGWFRDFDARNNKPIILKDYYDVMMRHDRHCRSAHRVRKRNPPY